ncbi:hypothetical protein [Hymenobacter sp. BT559]|uniref:hypothetical protein n=1 Tax=Hymenobacter sp. BT559 TaxID=2795729 RepID=UPI0018EBBAA6|nr:hypothetical protein [Hymenobacter sp. BT559]MBJ6146377.1 hypothetical protein [Hymenobacter sp. BT559]
MRKLSLHPSPDATSQLQVGFAYWATLTAAPLPNPAHQQVALLNARFVVALAQQYQQQGCSQQELLDAAYRALVHQMQTASPAQVERFLAHDVRQAMLLALEAKP